MIDGLEVRLEPIPTVTGFCGMSIYVRQESIEIHIFAPAIGRGVGGMARFDLSQWEVFKQKVSEIDQKLAQLRGNSLTK